MENKNINELTAGEEKKKQKGRLLIFSAPSGSGKSTLISLLSRFNEPTSGQIVYGDTPIHQLTLANWREQIALVSQHIVLFDDSIAANIAEGYGRYTPADRKRFFLYARGSFEETKCRLRKAFRRKIISAEEVVSCKKLIDELGPKLNAFIKATQPV